MESSLVSGRTRVCGVIGDPVEHSMSPVMHNAAFRELGLEYVYVALRVVPEELGNAIAGMRAFNIRGINVTMPHKVALPPLLDQVDDMAMKIGAVNTVVNDEGTLKGYNTDAPGFLQALRGAGVEPEDSNVAVLGAGGAARAISYILAANGAHPVILNRELELDWAEELAGWLSRHFRVKVRALELNEENLAGALETSRILVNATSVGMRPDNDKTPVPKGLLRRDLAVFDAVYNPVNTRLLKEAGQAGALAVSGLDMLVWQGALAFERFTGHRAPFPVMKREALKALGHEE